MGRLNVLAKFEVRIAVPIPEIIEIGSLGGMRTPILGNGRPQGVGDGAVGKSVGKFL